MRDRDILPMGDRRFAYAASFIQTAFGDTLTMVSLAQARVGVTVAFERISSLHGIHANPSIQRTAPRASENLPPTDRARSRFQIFANAINNSDAPSVAYATVYPLTMLLRILVAQALVVFFVH